MSANVERMAKAVERAERDLRERKERLRKAKAAQEERVADQRRRTLAYAFEKIMTSDDAGWSAQERLDRESLRDTLRRLLDNLTSGENEWRRPEVADLLPKTP